MLEVDAKDEFGLNVTTATFAIDAGVIAYEYGANLRRKLRPHTRSAGPAVAPKVISHQ